MHAGVHPLAWPDTGHLSFAVAISTRKIHLVVLTTLCTYTVSQISPDG